MMLSEMGEHDLLEKLLAWTDKQYSPVWESDGSYHYPTDHKEVMVRLIGHSKKSTSVTGHLLAFARANPKNGMWSIHSQPFDDAHFLEPVVRGIDYPQVLLSRAIYDRSKRALIITVEPGKNVTNKTTTFKVEQLDPGITWQLLVDGRKAGTYQGQDKADITVTLDKGHDIILMADETRHATMNLP